MDTRAFEVRVQDYDADVNRDEESQHFGRKMGNWCHEMGHIFHWRGHLNGLAEWSLQMSPGIFYGLLYIDESTQWGLDVLVGAEFVGEGRDKKVCIYTHQLRLKEDTLAWDVHSVCVCVCVCVVS